jgi:hypothetical protein
LTANIKIHGVEGKRAAPPAQPAAENRQGKAAKVASTSSSSAPIPDERTTAVSNLISSAALTMKEAATSMKESLSAREVLEGKLVERIAKKISESKSNYEEKLQELRATRAEVSTSQASSDQLQKINELEVNVAQLRMKLAGEQVPFQRVYKVRLSNHILQAGFSERATEKISLLQETAQAEVQRISAHSQAVLQGSFDSQAAIQRAHYEQENLRLQEMLAANERREQAHLATFESWYI